MGSQCGSDKDENNNKTDIYTIYNADFLFLGGNGLYAFG